jgi:branched-chain amino acid transport system ATP-binding protein
MIIVMVEHKLDVIRRLTRLTLVMNQGRLIVDDTPEAALGHPEVAVAYLGRTATAPTTSGAARAGFALADPPRPRREGEAPGPAVELDGVDVFYGPIQALFRV